MSKIYEYDQSIDQYINPETGELIEGIPYTKEVLKSVVTKIKISEAKSNTIKSEIDRLSKLLDREKTKQNNWSQFGLDILKQIEEKAVDYDTFKVSAYNNPGKLEIDPLADLAKYTTVEVVEKEKVDKKQIKQDIKDGLVIPGVSLIKTQRLNIS